MPVEEEVLIRIENYLSWMKLYDTVMGRIRMISWTDGVGTQEWLGKSEEG